MFNVADRSNRLWLSGVGAALVVALLGLILNFGHGGVVAPDTPYAGQMSAVPGWAA